MQTKYLIGGVLVAVILSVIAWGQLRPLDAVPSSQWAHVAPVCADPGAGAAPAIAVLLVRSLPIRDEGGPCDGRSAIHIRVSEADVDRVHPPSVSVDAVEAAAGVFERSAPLGTIVDCDVWIASGGDTKAIVLEVLHCLGYDHLDAAPVGHVLNRDYERVNLQGDKNWRGIP